MRRLVPIASLVLCGCVGGTHQGEPVPSAPTATDVFVVGNLIRDDECVVDADESSFLLTGRFDVGTLSGCANGYAMNILVHTRFPEPPCEQMIDCWGPRLYVTRAEVALRSVDDALLDIGGPNPFQVSAQATVPLAHDGEPGQGLVLVEAIPPSVRPALAALGAASATIRADVTLTLEATGGTPFVIDPLRWPIELCDGCMSMCGSEVSAEERFDAIDGQCPDNAGADGRMCFDDGC